MLNLSIASPTTISFPTKPILQIPKSFFSGIQIRPIRMPLRQTTSSGSRPSSSVVMMAKGEEEMKEIRDKMTEEINEEVDLKGELFMLRLQKSVRHEFKSSEFRHMRKRLEQGLNERLSRKLDQQWKKSAVVRPPPSLKKLQEEEAAAEAVKST